VNEPDPRDADDPDRHQFDELLWLRSNGFDVQDEIDDLLDRRASEETTVQELAADFGDRPQGIEVVHLGAPTQEQRVVETDLRWESDPVTGRPRRIPS
jgi:hypothetical protein